MRHSAKPLNGQEASILALFALCAGRRTPRAEKERLMAPLGGAARLIARELTGEDTHDRRAQAAASGFKRWAREIEARTAQKQKVEDKRCRRIP